MKKNYRLLVKGLVLVLVLFLAAGTFTACGSKGDTGSGDNQNAADAPEIQKMTIACQPQLDTYPTYSVIQEDLDKEKGLELDLMFFDSGMPQIEAIPAHQWAVASTGNVPALMSVLRYDANVIGIAADESTAQGVMARPDSPVFQTQGYNPEYPNVFGKPEDVKGKTFLCTTVSSGHYILSGYLKAMGLTEKDVVIKNLEQAQAMAAFESGEGDFAVLWSPFMYRGLEKGWKMAATGLDVGTQCLMVYVTDPQFSAEHPDLVVKYLDLVFGKVDQMKAEGENLAPNIQAYFKDWAAMDLTEADVKLDIQTHPLYDLKEQLEIFKSGQMEQWMGSAVDFFVSQGKFTAEEGEQLKAKKFGVTDQFIKTLAQEKGIQ